MRFNKIATVLQNAVSRSRTQMLTTGARRSLRPYSSLKFGPELFLNSASRLHSRNCSWQRYSFQPWRQAGYSSQPTSFPDPSRPDFFYHLVDPPTPVSHEKPAFALSFLSSPPVSSNSSTIVGWLPASSTGASGETSLADFKENPAFREILHEAIRGGLREGIDEIHVNGAIQLQHGWMHIHDDRNIPPLGRIGDPDDILATVLVEDSKIVPETYQPMPSYRVCTSDGVTQLTPGLAQRLRTLLVARAEEERT